LQQKLGVDESNLIFSNGAEEGIRLIAQIFLNQGEKAVIPTPIFDAYSTATLLMGAVPVKLPLKNATGLILMPSSMPVHSTVI
jgi:histidinol-phosphate aminotransferase